MNDELIEEYDSYYGDVVFEVLWRVGFKELFKCFLFEFEKYIFLVRRFFYDCNLREDLFCIWC